MNRDLLDLDYIEASSDNLIECAATTRLKLAELTLYASHGLSQYWWFCTNTLPRNGAYFWDGVGWVTVRNGFERFKQD